MMNERKELGLFPFYYILSLLYKFPIKKIPTTFRVTIFKFLIGYQCDEMNNTLHSKEQQYFMVFLKSHSVTGDVCNQPGIYSRPYNW